jgi:streptogramin lyase
VVKRTEPSRDGQLQMSPTKFQIPVVVSSLGKVEPQTSSERGSRQLRVRSDHSLRGRRFLRASAIISMSAVPFVGIFAGAQAAGAATPQSYPSQTTIGTGLNHPDGVAVDASGNVYIADTRNNRVIEVPANGGPQFTVGSGFQYPQGVALDSHGNLYVADSNNNRVVEVNLRTGQQTTVATGLDNPTSVAIDPAGNVYIANTNSGQVLELRANTSSTTVVASALVAPFGVGVDLKGDLFIADSGDNSVRELPVGGGPQASLGTGLNFPTGVAVDLAGDVFIANYGANQVIELPAGGGPQTTIGTGFQAPQGVAVSAQGTVFVADQNNSRVVELAAPTTVFALPTSRLVGWIYSAIVVSSVDYLPVAGQTVTFSAVNPRTGVPQTECTAVTDFLGLAYCFGSAPPSSSVTTYTATSTGSPAYQAGTGTGIYF